MTDGGRRLEEALKKAQTDPEARMDFYRLLLDSKVYVAGEKERKGANGGEPHTHIKQWTQRDGSLAMPFFATVGSFKETLGESESYVLIPVIDLFRMAGEATLVMTTPDGAKDFKPPEVASILASLVPKDPVSAALQKAIQNPGGRPAFYNALINAKVYVFGGNGETLEEGRTEEKHLTLANGDKLSFAAWTHPSIEGPVTPFFSSLELLNRAARQEGTHYMAFLGMDFLKMAAGLGRPLILNPGYEFNHLFSVEEVEHIIKASKMNQAVERALKPGLKVLFSQPENYPYAIVDALCDFLPDHPAVAAAYITVMREAAAEAPPILVIGFEADDEGEVVKMFSAAGELVKNHEKEGQTVDFALVRPGEEGVSRHFLENAEPFYRRKLVKTPQAPQKASSAKNEQERPEIRPGFLGRLKKIFSGRRPPSGPSLPDSDGQKTKP
ncbi:MAG: enhanced serine sensitivity protein SseB C-terminal domain-containing protein [Candidatus Adiutrix sp.]|jgi:hypothetical protein|nr:enhanced serine sensitivity protein SseB C-terminal domain-containing protein [Candidatus Adiutrix sp.]